MYTYTYLETRKPHRGIFVSHSRQLASSPTPDLYLPSSSNTDVNTRKKATVASTTLCDGGRVLYKRCTNYRYKLLGWVQIYHACFYNLLIDELGQKGIKFDKHLLNEWTWTWTNCTKVIYKYYSSGIFVQLTKYQPVSDNNAPIKRKKMWKTLA